MTQRGKLCFPTSPFDIQCLAVDITLRGGQTRFYSWGYEILRIHECRISYFYFACLPPLDLQNSIILRTAIVINNEGGLGGD